MLRVDPDYFGAKIAQNKRKQDSSRPSFLSPILQRQINQEDISRFRWQYPACSHCRQDKYFCLALKGEKHQKGNNKSKQCDRFCQRKAQNSNTKNRVTC